MGRFRHDTIVVTGYTDSVKDAQAVAIGAFWSTEAAVSEVTLPGVNGYTSFFVAPDGSKEGWKASDDADAARQGYTAWLDTRPELDWVAVTFGGDEPEIAIVRTKPHAD